MITRKKTAVICFSCVLILFLFQIQVSAESSGSEAVSEGQRRAVIRVVSITGNELTYYEVAQEEDAEGEEKAAESEETTEGGEKAAESEETTEGGEKVAEPEETTEGEEKAAEQEEDTDSAEEDSVRDIGPDQNPRRSPQGEDGTFTPPQGEDGTFTPPQGEDGTFAPPQGEDGTFTPPQGEDGMFTPPQGEDGTFTPPQRENGESGPGRMKQMTQETTTVYLPVSVVVHTDTEEERTFSILKEGDELEALFEENAEGNEVIVEIWMKRVEGDGE